MRTGLYRWFERHRWAGDAVVALLLFVALVINAREFSHRSSGLPVLLILSSAPLLVRRTLPEVALAFGIVVLALNLWLIDTATFAVALAPLLVHAAVVHARQRVWGRVALLAGLVGSVLAPLRWGYHSSGPTVLAMAVGLCAVSVIAAFVVGERQRDRQEFHVEQVRSLTERATLLAAERDQRARAAAAIERTRIARELHDIVAHSLSVVIVQADGAAAAVAFRPELAQSVLRTISETSREALAEMRRLVGVLRDPDGSGSAGYAPSQGLGDLDALVEQVQQTGISVELVITGPERPLPTGLGLTVFRLVQEALTNVLKHAGPAATVVIELTYAPAGLRVSVADDGRGAAESCAAGGDPVVGHGLVGMAERVRLRGGRLRVGPQPGGGFRVDANFELPGEVAQGSS